MPKLRIPITKKIRDEVVALIPQLRAEGIKVTAIEFTDDGVRILSSGATLDADDKAAIADGERKVRERIAETLPVCQRVSRSSR